jgi:hypothetical protein
MKRLVPVMKVLLLVLVVGAMACGGLAYAKKPGSGDGPCHPEIMCPMVWDPVLCPDGKIYSNACVAFVWCQTNCEPIGGGPVPLIE